MTLITNSSSAILVGTSTSFSMPVAFTLTMGAVTTSGTTNLQFINQYSALQIGDAGSIVLAYGTSAGAESASTGISEPTGSGINSYLMVVSDRQIQVFFNGNLIIDNTSVNNENNSFPMDFLDYEIGNSPVIYQMGVADTGITTMPAFTIGTGSVFQANANPQSISTQVTAPVGYGGNATYQLYSYDIPVGPSMHYLTVLYASTDYFSDQGTTPATYLLFPQYHFITFFNISGFTQIYVSLLEPSSLLGQSVPVTIQPVQNNNSVVIPDVHLSAVYEAFGTSTPVQAVSYGTTVTLPYGSTASFLLYNPWN